MKPRSLSVLALLTAAILLWGCGGGGYAQSGSTNVTVSVGSVASTAAVGPRSATIPSEVASLRLTVSSTATPADMTPIVSTLAVTPGVTTYQLSVTVPNGSRGFLLEAFDSTSTLRYRGYATMDLTGGTASLTIQMSATVTFSQTDLAGTWDGIYFGMGIASGWKRAVVTIDNSSGGITWNSLVDSAGGTSVPLPGTVTWTISATGVVNESSNSTFHGQMSSNKQLVIGTDSGTTPGSPAARLRVFRKRTGTAFSSADLANKTFTFHVLHTGTDNTWSYGAGTADGSGLVTITSEVNPSGPHTPGSGGTWSVSPAGIVTIPTTPTWYGLMTDDKKVIFIIESSGTSYSFGVITITGQTYTQSDYEGIYNWSVIRNNVPNPGWAYGGSSIDAAGAGTYLSYTDSGGGATPAGFTRVLSSSGVVTIPEDASAHGQMSYNKDIIVRTNTSAAGRYGLVIGFKIAGTASAPAFSPAPGTYTSAQSVTLSTATSGANIRYTTDGSTPTSTTGTVYSVPIAVSATTTIKAIAYLAGWVNSSVASGTYTITPVGTTYSISGTVSGAISSGVTITVTGTATAAATTAADGSYTVTGLHDGSYTVTPSMAGFAFAPSSSAATVSGANSTGKDFVATAAPGTYTASGTYAWNSATGVLSSTWTSSNFPCNGPDVGAQTDTGVTITSTTMTFPNDGMTWSRPSGTANDIVGTWTWSDSPGGNSYTLIVNANGTLSLVGVIDIVSCASAQAQHWSSGYYVQLEYGDSRKTATSVSVTGPGITGSKALTYNTTWGSWVSWTLPSTPVNLGTTSPSGLPFTYTFSITDTTTWTATSTVSCFQEQFVTNLSLTGAVTGTPSFSWTGIGDSSATYGVELNQGNNDRGWSKYNISGTSIVYDGPALTAGATYYYFVQVMSSSACRNQSSFVSGSFTRQ